MIFEQNPKEIKFRKYVEEVEEVERRISFKREIAEDINELIAFYNKDDSTNSKINSSDIVNTAMQVYINQIKGIPSEKIIDFLKYGVSTEE